MIRSNSDVMANEKIKQRFELLNHCERLAHAYLFTGPKGSGKFQTAMEVAKLVNCECSEYQEGCACDSCRKIDLGNHPDIIVIDRGEDQSIKIHKIRELIQKAQLFPYEAKKKVVIIREIDLLTSEGSNALLKTLEEPASSSMFFLTTAIPERVFETIRSRCHLVHFFGCSRLDIIEQLKSLPGITDEQCGIIASFAEGCFGKACRMHDEKFIAFKNDVIEQFLVKGVDDRFLKSITADNEKITQALEILIFCFKDILLLQAGVSAERLTNHDLQKELRMYSSRYSTEQLRDVLASIINMKKMQDAGLNTKIPLMLLKEKIWNNN